MNKILIVEDAEEIYQPLCELLTKENYVIDLAVCQNDAIAKIEQNHSVYDLILLDIRLPDGHGFSVFSAAKEYLIPVIFLTAVDDERTTVAGLDMGAFDYIQKPYRNKELLSRIKSSLRKSGKMQAVIQCGDISIDTTKGVALKNGEDLYLSALEYRLLLVFFNNMGNVITREKLFDEIWGITGEYVDNNTLSVYIKRLRKKIEDDALNPQIIKTARGIGYRVDKQ